MDDSACPEGNPRTEEAGPPRGRTLVRGAGELGRRVGHLPVEEKLEQLLAGGMGVEAPGAQRERLLERGPDVNQLDVAQLGPPESHDDGQVRVRVGLDGLPQALQRPDAAPARRGLQVQIHPPSVAEEPGQE